MSSPTATASTTPYTYHTAAELATRHLVSPPSSSSTSSSASTDSPTSPAEASSRPGLERRTTRNYEEALAATSAPSSASEPPTSETAASSTGGSGSTAGGSDRPKPLSSTGRQQSYEIRDMRRAVTQSYLADDKPDAGYTSATRK